MRGFTKDLHPDGKLNDGFGKFGSSDASALITSVNCRCHFTKQRCCCCWWYITTKRSELFSRLTANVLCWMLFVYGRKWLYLSPSYKVIIYYPGKFFVRPLFVVCLASWRANVWWLFQFQTWQDKKKALSCTFCVLNTGTFSLKCCDAWIHCLPKLYELVKGSPTKTFSRCGLIPSQFMFEFGSSEEAERELTAFAHNELLLIRKCRETESRVCNQKYNDSGQVTRVR